MEPVAKFNVHFTGVIPVKSAKGEAIVEFDATVGYVQGVERSGNIFAEFFAQGEIECGVLRQIGAGVGLSGERVGEAGAVVNVGEGMNSPGKSEVAADVQRVALIMIEGR